MILIMMDSALLFKRNFEKKLLKDKKKKPISLPLMIYHVQLLTMQFFFFEAILIVTVIMQHYANTN